MISHVFDLSFDVLSPNLFSSFQGRKYGDKFAEKLSTILPELTALKKLE